MPSGRSCRPCRLPCTPGDLPSLGCPLIPSHSSLSCHRIARSNGLGRMTSDGLGRMASDAQRVGTCMAHAISCSSPGRHGDLVGRSSKLDTLNVYDRFNISSFKELELQGGAGLFLPVGVNDTVIPVYDDELTSTISYGKAGIVQEAVKIFQKMEELGVDRTIKSYDDFFKLRLDTANRFYEDMKTRGIAPDAVMYNTLINGYTRFKRMEEAEKLFVEMKAKNLAPTAASDVLKAMIRLSIPTEAGNYGVLIENFCKANEFDQAIKLLDKLVENEIVLRLENSLEIESIRTLIRALMDRGNQMMDEADQAIDRAKKVVQDTVDVGTETAAALKAQFATDKCIMALLFLIVIGVIAIIIVKSWNGPPDDMSGLSVL
ncbi:hypothetical protein F3Y22_tig00112354pilonHSYRG00009 [Hibiscus syriacus]|uniref:Pentatricopeptide repeat-containing protein n=1 Tax=Hibiscus syriacus TaxID=106335 RepID=A0A6A2X0M8_HIBSY|nr:hypothetical protein F3Y22_tig00112354pilonHSYRG00009 [Hibiscus syriacus]